MKHYVTKVGRNEISSVMIEIEGKVSFETLATGPDIGIRYDDVGNEVPDLLVLRSLEDAIDYHFSRVAILRLLEKSRIEA